MVSIVVRCIKVGVRSGAGGLDEAAAHGDAVESEGVEGGDILGGHAADGISREGEGVELESTIASSPKMGASFFFVEVKRKGPMPT